MDKSTKAQSIDILAETGGTWIHQEKLEISKLCSSHRLASDQNIVMSRTSR